MTDEHSGFEQGVEAGQGGSFRLPRDAGVTAGADEAADLAGLVASRICHDLISPIGAVGNGVELIGHGRRSRSPELGLIAESASDAERRVRLFRLAFGASSGAAELPAEQMRGLLDGLTAGRQSYVWEGEEALPRAEVRCALLALLCLKSALPRGGTIRVLSSERWAVQAEAERIAPDAALWAHAAGDAPRPDVTAAQVQFVLLPRALAAVGRAARLEEGRGRLTVRF